MAKRTAPTGVGGLLGAAASKSTSASKSKAPQVPVPDALTPNLLGWLDAKRDEDLAKSRRIDFSEKMMDFAEEQRVKISRLDGKAHTTIKLTEPGGNSVKWTAQNSFTKMPLADAEAILTSAFGRTYDQYFSVRPNISIKDGITDDQATALTEALTKANLLELVEVNPVIQPSEKFAQDLVLSAKVAAIADEVLQKSGHLRQKRFFKA